MLPLATYSTWIGGLSGPSTIGVSWLVRLQNGVGRLSEMDSGISSGGGELACQYPNYWWQLQTEFGTHSFPVVLSRCNNYR